MKVPTKEGEELEAKAAYVAREMGKYNPLSTEEAIELYQLLYKMLGRGENLLPDWAEEN
jgi:histone acetyltransferase (RNA polymerase elongator complex component)